MVHLLLFLVSVLLPVLFFYSLSGHQSAKVRVFVEWVSDVFANHPQMRLGGRGAGVESPA